MAHIAEGLRAQHGLRAVSDMPCVRLSILELLVLIACANLYQGLEPLLSLVPGVYVQGFSCVDVHRKSKRYTYCINIIWKFVYITINKCDKVTTFISCLS